MKHMKMNRRMIGGLAASFAGLFILNAFLLVHTWFPEYQVVRILASSADLTAFYFLIYLWALLPEKRDRLIARLLGAAAGLAFFFAAGEAFTRFWYDQPFVPWTDLSYIPAIVDMVFHVETGEAVTLGVVMVIVAVFGLAIAFLFRWIIRGARSAGPVYLAVPALFLALSLTLGFDRTLGNLVTSSLGTRRSETVTMRYDPPAVRSGPEYGFPFLRDGDIYLILVESYGHTLFTNPSHRELILPFYAEYQGVLDGAGLTVGSTFLDSPTTGGRSWFADATLWTGIRVDNQQLYDDLVGSGVKSLPALLTGAGYSSALIAPGTKEADGDWRATYPFDRYIFRWDFGYEGPFFNLGAMPDQFILKRTAETAADPAHAGKPFFATVILVSSHVPFDRVPLYIEDWEDLGDGEVYNGMEMRLFANNWLTGGEYPEGYTAGIMYSLRSTFEFLIRYLPENAVAVVVGDHQPRLPVRERGASSSVPIHVISRRGDLPDAFSAFGFTPGLVPEQPLPHRGMELFMSDFLAVAHGIPVSPFTP